MSQNTNQKTMIKTCTVSGKEFEITDDDLKFYEKMGVPVPTLCPEERMRRRLAFRNERSLYHRECDGTAKKIISMYSSKKPFPVYENEYWWSDNWDARDYGQDFDFAKPFFSQFEALLNKVPKMARIQQGENVNSQFCNCASYNKNCYLIFSANRNEDCLYGTFFIKNINCMDNFHISECELNYECINCEKCYESHFLQNCKNCHNSYFLKNCIGCNHCFGSINLRNKEFYFLNKKCTKEEYTKKIKTLELEKYSNLRNMRTNFLEFSKKFPEKFTQVLQNQNCTGNHLYNSKNAENCWDGWDLDLKVLRI